MTAHLFSWDGMTIFIGGVATLAIFSFLIKENPLYRFFEHIFIGISAGLGVIVTVKNLLWPSILKPLLGLDIHQYPDGTYSHEYNYYLLLYILPMSFGLLYYFIYSKRHGWLAKLVIGFSLGMSGGLSFRAFFNETIPQIVESFKPLVVRTAEHNIDLFASFSNSVFVCTLLAVMYYFFFSFRTDRGPGRYVSSTGRWLMMVCFGAFFGSTVMARMALLVERLSFLLEDWAHVLATVFV